MQQCVPFVVAIRASMISNHEEAASIMHKGKNGRFLTAREEVVGFGQDQRIEIAQVERIARAAISERARVGHQTIASCLLQSDTPGTDASCPVRLLLWIGIFSQWVGLTFTNHPIGVPCGLCVSIVEEHPQGRRLQPRYWEGSSMNE